ncbi:MAG: hypothetical protein V4714_20230 [Bacteroidota bacterium]
MKYFANVLFINPKNLLSEQNKGFYVGKINLDSQARSFFGSISIAIDIRQQVIKNATDSFRSRAINTGVNSGSVLKGYFIILSGKTNRLAIIINLGNLTNIAS